MRTYGRIKLGGGGDNWTADSIMIIAGSPVPVDASAAPNGVWQEVDTDSNGNNDLVWLTTLTQVLLLNLNESPFYATYGIPAYPSVVQQVFPDYYVALTQQAFSPYFASLQITKQAGRTPRYLVAVITHQGVKLNASVPIPI